MMTDEGRVFIDRNPKGFELMLDWLRNNGKVIGGNSAEIESQTDLLHNELEYWSIDRNLFGEKTKDKFESIAEAFKRPIS